MTIVQYYEMEWVTWWDINHICQQNENEVNWKNDATCRTCYHTTII